MGLFSRKKPKGIASGTTRLASDMQIAIRPQEDQHYYLKESGNFLDINSPSDLSELRKRIRSYSIYDDTLSIVIRLCSMFVTAGARIECDDSQNQECLQEFFKAQNMQEFLQDFVMEYFISGEATSFAYWNNRLKCFTDEQILDPDKVDIKPSLYKDEDRYIIAVPERVAQVFEDSDNPEYMQARQELSELYNAEHQNLGLNVDSDKIIRIVNKSKPWDLRGTPIFSAALSALAQKESLDAALYEQLQTLIVPTIVGEVGLRAGELGQGSQAWYPTQQELDKIRDTYRELLMAKLRVGVFPIGVKWSNAFGGSQVPNLDNDYRRCQTSILRCVAAGQGLLDGSAGGPFASNAINRDVFSSFLQSIRCKVVNAYQRRIDTAIKQLGIYAYTIPTSGKNVGKRTLVKDDNGQPILEQAHLAFDDGIMRDANAILQTLMQLRNADVPVSKDTLAKASGLDINVMEEVRKLKEESNAIDNMQMDDVIDLSNNDDTNTDTSMSGSEVRSPLSSSNL